MIRRKKTTIFTDAKDTTTVLELKKMIEGKFEWHLGWPFSNDRVAFFQAF